MPDLAATEWIWALIAAPLAGHLGGPAVRHLGGEDPARGAATPLALALALLAMAAWAALHLSGWRLWTALFLGWVLLVLAAIDLRRMILPDRLTLPLAGVALGAAVVATDAWPDHLLGMLAGYVIFAGIGRVYRHWRGMEGLGMGDAKLLAAAGAWVGWQGLPLVVLAASLGALAASLPRIARRGRAAWHDRLAFGPFLCAGTWLVWVHGPLNITL